MYLFSNLILMSLPGISLGRLIFTLSSLLVFASPLFAQLKFRDAPNQQTPNFLEEAQASEFYDQFLKSQMIGNFELIFDLEIRPYRKPTRVYSGLMIGSWLSEEKKTTVKILNPNNGQHILSLDASHSEQSIDLGIKRNDDKIFQLLPPEKRFESLHENIPLSPFAFTFEFLYWPQKSYLGPTRILGRPAHQFRLTTPDSDQVIKSVDVTIDEDFYALLEASFLDENKNILKSLEVRGFGKIDDQWTIKHWRIASPITKDSIHFKVSDFSIQK